MTSQILLWLSKSKRASLNALVTVAFLLQSAGCASGSKSHEQVRQDAIEAGRCDDALKEVSKQDPGTKIADTSKQVAGTLLSYSLTGASYTAEVLWDFAGGTVMFVGLCSPWIVTSAAGMVGSNYSSNGTPTPWCFPGKINALGAPPLGRNTFKATKNFRCPSVVPVSQSIRAVANCYFTKGDDQSLVKARQSLNALQGSKDVYECLPEEEKQTIQKLSDEINLKMIAKEPTPAAPAR